jgi:hypothetical protein
MGMQGKDPDWIINIGGYIVRECIEWEFTDDEKDQSEIRVLLPNPENILDGKFKYGMDMTIRFGYANEMSPEAYLPVAEIDYDYPSDKGMTIEVIGRDESSKMSGGNNKGNQGKGDDKAQLKQNLQNNGGLQMTGDTKGADSGCKGACYNESDKALAYRWGNAMAAQGAANTESGGNEPISPLADDASGGQSTSAGGVNRHDGYTTSHSGDWSGDGKGGKDRAKNRQGNKSGQDSQAPITATLKLRGFPTLRAKSNVTITGIGSDNSGTYYVKKVKHEWKGKGFVSTAELTRGGCGKGGVGGSAPIVMYANIWKRGEMYCGPRKTDGQAQATFVYGQDDHWMGCKVKIKPQPQRGGGEPKKGKAEGMLLKQKLKPTSTSDGGSSGGLSGSAAGAVAGAGQ